MSTADIKHLRDQTGVGMMDAKRALEASGGNIATAIEHLRKTGQKVAAARSTHQAREGVIGVWLAPNRKHGALVALACETDFVARTPKFQTIAAQLAMHLGTLEHSVTTPDKFLIQPGLNGDVSVQQTLETLISSLGENIQIPSIAVISSEVSTIANYLHTSGKIATMIVYEKGNDEVGRNVAMHVAAMNPTYLNIDAVPAEVLEKEQEIFREQLKGDGKPEALWNKILPGQVKKFLADVCLLEQPFVKDDTITVKQYLKDNSNGIVNSFIRVAI